MLMSNHKLVEYGFDCFCLVEPFVLYRVIHFFMIPGNMVGNMDRMTTSKIGKAVFE